MYKLGCFKVVPVFSFSEPSTAAAAWAPQAWISRAVEPTGSARTGTLAGLRFAAKDNINAAGLPTTAGCAAFAYQPATNAAAVQRLLDGAGDRP